MTETAETRDHTERALAAFGATVARRGPTISVEGRQRLAALQRHPLGRSVLDRIAAAVQRHYARAERQRDVARHDAVVSEGAAAAAPIVPAGPLARVAVQRPLSDQTGPGRETEQSVVADLRFGAHDVPEPHVVDPTREEGTRRGVGADDQIGAELLHSLKNGGEHSIVATTIRAALEPRVANLTVDPEPHLRRLPNVQHLETRISGDLLPGQTILDLIGELHPTPAVGGFPRAEALAHIRATEQLDRGWYASPVGWIDARGDGEWAVALRGASIDGTRATLHAGAGIVDGSVPADEWRETEAKLEPMLHALTALTTAD